MYEPQLTAMDGFNQAVTGDPHTGNLWEEGLQSSNQGLDSSLYHTAQHFLLGVHVGMGKDKGMREAVG